MYTAIRDGDVCSPSGHPLLGHARELSREGLLFLRQCARDYGDLVSLRFFWKPILFVNHPDQIAQVLVAQQRKTKKNIAQRADRVLVGNGLFLSEGEFWLRQRRLMQPAFHRERIVSYVETMVEHTGRMLQGWRDGEVRDIYRSMCELTMGILSQTLFGAAVWDDASEVAAALDDVLTCMGARVRSIQVLLPDTLPTPNNLRLLRSRRRINRLVHRIIADRRACGEDRDDLLAMLLRARDEHGAALPMRQVHDEVMTLLVGGHETAADLLAWTWYLLAQHPEVETQLSAELTDVLGNRVPTFDDLPRLVYTGMIISEALRLYPPAPALGREVTEAFDLAGHRVAAGTDIIMSQWIMQRDPRYFPDPEAFQPSRWEHDLAGRLPRYAYFPFGGGSRLCIGHAFATTEATLVLATIAQRFRLDLAQAEPIAIEMIPTLRPKHGLRMAIRQR